MPRHEHIQGSRSWVFTVHCRSGSTAITMRPMSQTEAVQVHAPSFEDMVASVMHDLQTATSDLLNELEPIRRAVDLERSLEIDRKLAWQIFRLSRSTGLGDLENVPSPAPALRVIDAARGRGVSETTTERVKGAFDRFEKFVTVQCGDRASLMSMVSGLTHGRSENLELRVRKSLHRDSAHVWGLKAAKQIRTLIYDPCGPSGGTLRGILISGSLGLQGLRRGEPLVISSWLSPTPIEGQPGTGTDSPGVAPQFEILRDYCSHNLPDVSHVPGKSGVYETEMQIPPTGRAGAVTLYLTQSSRTGGDARDVGAGAGMFISVPAAEVVIELLVPAGYTSPATARVTVFGRRHHPERAMEERDTDMLPQREAAVYLGRVSSIPSLDGVPHHRDIVRHVLDRNGLLGREFDAYRCRVLYPVMHTLAVMRVDGTKSR
jgi:hypothetical protein